MTQNTKPSKPLIERLGYGLLIFVMLITLFILALPHLLGCQFEAILSGSMSPALKEGDLVIVLPVNPYAIRIGDIIAYHPPSNPSTLIVHRVVGVNHSSSLNFRTKGDANPSLDAYPVPAQNVVGRMSFHLPWIGYFARFAQSTWGFILLLAIPGAVIIYGEVNKLWDALGAKKAPRRGKVTINPMGLYRPAVSYASLSSLGFKASPDNFLPNKSTSQRATSREYQAEKYSSSPSATPKLKILPGRLDGLQFRAERDAEGSVIALDYGEMPPGYNHLCGETLRIRNLSQATLKVTAVFSGDMAQFCRDVQLRAGAEANPRWGNPLALRQGEEARLEVTLGVPLSTETSGSYHDELLISTDEGGVERRIGTSIMVVPRQK